MKPLSAMKFFIENKRRTAIIILILLLSVTVVSFVTSLVNSIMIDAFNSNIKPFQYFSAVDRTSDEIFVKDSVVDIIKSYPETERVINVMAYSTQFNALLGNTSSPVYFINNESDLKYIMEKTKLSVSEGRLPEGADYEVVLHESLLKNKGLEIGDYIGSDVQEDEWLRGKYKIVGSLTGEAIMGLGNKAFAADKYEEAGLSMDKPMALIVVPKEGQLDKLNEQLNKIDRKDAQVLNFSIIKRKLDRQIESVNALMQIIIFAVVFILSVSVGAFVYIIYMQRSDEFGILYAMGYGKSFIKKLILKELAALSTICWFFGYILAMILTYTLNYILLSPNGKTLYFFTPVVFLNTLFIPAMVLICATYPILRRLRKWDPIAVIERRD